MSTEDHQSPQPDIPMAQRVPAATPPTASEPPTAMPPTPPKLQCVWCGYDLFGLDISERCPECSAPIRYALEDQRPYEDLVEGPNPVADRTPCVSCNHSLQGQRFSANCRQCGTPVFSSVQIKLLRSCDAVWLQTVRSGFTWWLWMLLVSLALGFVVGGFLAFFAMGTGGAPNTAKLMSIGLLSGSIVGVVSGSIYIIVVWKITMPNPSLPSQRDPTMLRALIRGACVLSVMISGVLMVLLMLETPVWTVLLLTTLGLPMHLISLGLMLYTRDIALRIPDRALLQFTTIVLIGVCASSLAQSASSLLQVAGTMSGAAPAGGSGALSCVVNLAALGFRVALVVLLFKFRSALAGSLALRRQYPALDRSQS